MAKCSECGFLTLRDKANGLLVEVIDDYRVSGKIPSYIRAFEGQHNWPICFVMAYDLFPEVQQAANKQFFEKADDWSPYVLEVITKERICPRTKNVFGFVKYHQGFTPKEHKEMMDRELRMKAERRWRIVEIILILVLSGLFTLLGAVISKGGL
jgi:hypothetical protein